MLLLFLAAALLVASCAATTSHDWAMSASADAAAVPCHLCQQLLLRLLLLGGV
jgi:hypothetical protein